MTDEFQEHIPIIKLMMAPTERKHKSIDLFVHAFLNDVDVSRSLYVQCSMSINQRKKCAVPLKMEIVCLYVFCTKKLLLMKKCQLHAQERKLIAAIFTKPVPIL